MKKALTVLLVAGAIAPATGAFEGAALAATNGGIGIRLAEAPVTRRDDPRARLYVVDHVAPGATIRRKVEVSNNTTSPQTIALYPAAAAIAKGEFTPEGGHAVNELSTWTKLDTAQLQLGAGQKRIIQATVAVPAKASSGERYGVIWAEVAAGVKTGVNQVNRVGIRMYLSVGPGGEPASDFTVDTLQANRLPDGQPVVYALVHNTGGRALDMSGSLRLTKGPGGLSAGPFTARLGTTLGIKDTEPVTVLLDKALPAGPWNARIDLASGLTKRAATAVITFPDAAGPGNDASAAPVVLQQNSSSSGFPVVPVIATVAGLGLVGFLALVVFKRPRRKGKRGGSHGKHGR
jgi:hypothetical protein